MFKIIITDMSVCQIVMAICTYYVQYLREKILM